ncbi:MAG TPA: FMN-binding negative transcriptional regulator [Granulicella sp.]
MLEAMYTPAANRESSTPILWQFLRENPLCALVTQTAQEMVATHLPMVLEEDGSPFGILRGHIARANMQWQQATLSAQALAVFTGPQHYISASWYPGKHVHGKEVPTWNYVAVHAYGRLRIVEDTDWLIRHLTALVDQSEVIVETPWRLSDAPPEFIRKMAGAIVGVEMPIERLEGKWKVSQNRSDEDAAAVMRGLDALQTPESATMKELIRSRRPDAKTD